MSVIEEYRDEIAWVFGEASREMESLPDGLREIGQALLTRSNPLTNGGGTNAISYLLPYWLQERTGTPLTLSRELSVGNLYMMLHYFVLDDAMDGGTGRLAAGLRRSLALGQLLQVMYRERYARYFSNESPLWAYERRYAEEWAAVVSREGAAPVDPRDRGKLAGKAAPIKLCVAGLLLSAGQPEHIADMEEAVELALAVLQLSDDWEDWREDLAESNGNAFLTIVRDKLDWPAGVPLDEQNIRRGIYRHGCANALADIAAEYSERLNGMPDVPSRLAGFGSAIARDLRAEARNVDESVHGLATGGGWSHFLSNLSN
ncbi:hypothetical protein [Cohnella sp. GCM10027633]|uniref:hypothetical protein n=1 Tax=unclassified Cohnella TaxID=2636738 RepID=UPI00363AA390